MNYLDMKETTSSPGLFRVTVAAIFSLAMVLSASLAGSEEWIFDGVLSDRAGEVAKELAVREATGFLADVETVEAFSADLNAIYAVYPGLAAATPWRSEADAIVVELDPTAVREEVLAAFPGEVGLEGISYLYHSWIVIQFRESVNARNLADWAVESIEGVVAATTDPTMGDGDDVIYDAAEDLYIFKRGEGDCISGCIDNSWRYVLMTATGPVEVSAAELSEIFPGELSTAYTGSLKVAQGDWLPLETLAPGSDITVVVDSVAGLEVIGDDIIYFGSESRYGRYQITVSRPYGLSPVVHTIDISAREGSSLIHGQRLLNGWVNDSEFGWVYDQTASWIYHADHSWLYLPSGNGSVDRSWAYDFKLGWCYLDRSIYPWIYGNSEGWLFYERGTNAPREFYRTASASWWSVE